MVASLLVIPVAGAPSPADAQGVQRIAAVVNDEAISVYDLLARLKMVILTSGLPDNEQTRNQLAPQVLRGLIDERLQIQEAKRLNIGVTQEEVQASLRRLEAQANMPENSIQDVLARGGIPFSTMEAQVAAQVAWTKVVSSVLRPTVSVGEEEVDEFIESARQSIGQDLYRIAEIYMAVDDPASETTVRERANALVEEVRNGASFPILARQFSESASAASNGDLGWLRRDQIPADLRQTVLSMESNTVSDPIRTSDGYYIVLLIQRRASSQEAPEETVSLQQISQPTGAGATAADKQAQADLFQTVAEVADGCNDFAQLGREMGAQVAQRLNNLKLSDLSDAIRGVIGGLQAGQVSRPIIQDQGVTIFMVCGRGNSSNLPSEDQAKAQLINQKLDLLARRYLRDLRNAAFVDLRV